MTRRKRREQRETETSTVEDAVARAAFLWLTPLAGYPCGGGGGDVRAWPTPEGARERRDTLT